MNLEKAISLGKERRRQYPPNDSRNIDWSCRNHRSCPFCLGNRTHGDQKLRLAEQAEQEALQNPEPRFEIGRPRRALRLATGAH
jgi:hypothetical protein